MEQNPNGPQPSEIWAHSGDDCTSVLVLRDGVFFADSIANNNAGGALQRLQAGGDPTDELGKKCWQANLDDVTRVEANDKGALKMFGGDKTLLKVDLRTEGMKVVEAVQDLKGKGWEVESQRRMRLGSALIALAVGLVGGAAMVWAYFGVVNGEIRRIHWLFAWLINSFGPSVLLITAALIGVVGLFASVYYLTHPAEVWTLEER